MGLKGTLADLGIIDLVQFPYAGRKSGELSVSSGGRLAKLYYDKGALVHAVLGDALGMDALVSMVDWTEGEFEFTGGVETKENTMELDLHRAVMQALKIHDELKAAEEKRRMEAPQNKTAVDPGMTERLEHFVSANEFALNAMLINGEGGLRAAAGQGSSADLEQLGATMNMFRQSYPRGELQRAFFIDEGGTVVLVRLQDGVSLVVVAEKETPLGAVSMAVARLASTLE
jgi:hypothetical protein